MLIDTTLREGEQFYGAYFAGAARKDIIRGLVASGVEEIELGCVGQEHIPDLAAWATGRGGETVFSAWCPCREDSLRQAAKLGLDRINVGVPVSDRHLSRRLGWTREHLLQRLSELVGHAAELGVKSLSVGFEDATGADPGFLDEAVVTAAQGGATRIRLADTLGLASPTSMAGMVGRIASKTTTMLAVHCHNDFGMATANALAALEAGASWADCSLMGIGERAGIAATEELAAFLATVRGEEYDLQALRDVCVVAAGQARLSIPRNKPVIGEDIFRCESGLHVHGIECAPELYEPYPPETVGMGRVLSLGGKSGRAAVRNALKSLDLPEPAMGMDALVSEVRRLSRELGRPLQEEEFVKLCRSRQARMGKAS